MAESVLADIQSIKNRPLIPYIAHHNPLQAPHSPPQSFSLLQSLSAVCSFSAPMEPSAHHHNPVP